MRRMVACLVVVGLSVCWGRSEDPSRVVPDGQPSDIRLKRVRTLDDTDFDLRVPASLEAWVKRREEVRQQILVANGLWPMPAKEPLNPVIHGKIERDGYTIEKVYFRSMPGHYVTGNLYRPGPTHKGPHAGVLFAHGHWENGRLHEVAPATVEKDLKSGGEKTRAGAKYPLQAPCVQLARMGCVVFIYDMVGVADSKPIPHRTGFTDPEAELRLQSFMGLQTGNSIRALDFLSSLPDVDPKRLGMTGASGGGTQTMLLGAIDDRLTAAFPAVMVSTHMQGGCVCENCSYLRQNTGNVEFAALFAPRPLGISGANDWTLEIEKKGLPELQAIYKLYGASDKVIGKCWPEYGHNYNQLAREMMENWFNRHLQLGQKEPIVETDFEPVPPAQLSVFDEAHPMPDLFLPARELRTQITQANDKLLEKLKPVNSKGLDDYRRIWTTALTVLVGGGLPEPREVEPTLVGEPETRDGITWRKFLLQRKEPGEVIPAIGMKGEAFDGTVVIWVHPQGKQSLWKDGKLVPEAQQILDRKAAIFALDAFGSGEMTPAKKQEVNSKYAAFTFGYNRPILAQRVHDILTAVSFVRGHDLTKKVHLVGWEEAGNWVLLARALCGDRVDHTAADAADFRFDSVRTLDDPMLLPGALKYGGMDALAALAAPGELLIHHQPTNAASWLKAAYNTAKADQALHLIPEKLSGSKVIDWLLGS